MAENKFVGGEQRMDILGGIVILFCLRLGREGVLSLKRGPILGKAYRSVGSLCN